MPKAIVCRELGPPESLRLETFAAAPLAQGQVRVAIQAAGINFPDILMAAGQYQLKPPLPFTPGMEAAGDVIEVDGAAQGVAVGDKVIVKMRHGAYADEAVVDAVATDAVAVDLRLCRGRDISRRPRHRLSRADRSRPASARRGAAGAWRRRRRRPCRGRDRQDARGDRDRGGLVGGKAGRGTGAGRRSSGALQPRAVSRCRQAHHRRARRRCGVRSGRRRDFRGQRALHRLGRAPARGRLYRRHRACPHQSVADQGRQRARRSRRRSGAEKPRARRGAFEGAHRMGGGRTHPAEHLAPAAAGELRAGDAAV